MLYHFTHMMNKSQIHWWLTDCCAALVIPCVSPPDHQDRGHLNAPCGFKYRRLNLLGVEGPGDHPHDAVTHGPGEPGSVRGEVHAPGLAPGPAQQGRGPPGLELQEESRVRGCSRDGEAEWSDRADRSIPPRHWPPCDPAPPRASSAPQAGERSPRAPLPGYGGSRWQHHYSLIHLRVPSGSALFAVEHIVLSGSFLTFSAVSPASWIRPPGTLDPRRPCTRSPGSVRVSRAELGAESRWAAAMSAVSERSTLRWFLWFLWRLRVFPPLDCFTTWSRVVSLRNFTGLRPLPPPHLYFIIGIHLLPLINNTCPHSLVKRLLFWITIYSGWDPEIINIR